MLRKMAGIETLPLAVPNPWYYVLFPSGEATSISTFLKSQTTISELKEKQQEPKAISSSSCFVLTRRLSCRLAFLCVNSRCS
jgi:hypothetical protein